MAENLDPEEWAEIMNEAFEYLTGPVYRYEGTVARLMGDAILAFFGAPIAHEEDPERAILAGLDIVNGIQPFRHRIKDEYDLDFNVRVGINTGPVVVGDVGSTQAGEYTAMGDEVNVAARMEQTASPGTVQIAENTHRLVAPLFEFESLGGVEVKGKSEAVQAYRVLARKTEPGRRRGIEGVSAPMVGREAEAETLRRVLQEVREGRGQIVCLIGEAGLGKSRRIEELRTEWEEEAGGEQSWVESRGVSYDTTRPYGQFQQRIRKIYGVQDSDSPEVVQQKVANAPHGLAPEVHEEIKPLVARAVELLLAVRMDLDQPRLEGEAIKREGHETVLRIWRGLATHSPLVMVFDDLQWVDPASAELLLHLLQLTEEAPILFLCAFRPERRSPAWQVKQAADSDYPHRYTEINLAPLSDQDSSTLVSSLMSVSDLPTPVRQMILQKAEGNPFFVEEVVRTLLDSGAVRRNGGDEMQWNATTNIRDIAIPDNLQALLISRFDRLEDEVRRTLQLAAVIGRSFYYEVLKRVSDATLGLDKHLSTLQRVEIIREAARIPELEYMFLQELTREAAYNSILRRRCRDFHRQVGEAMETIFEDRLEDQATRLAYHFDEGRDHERALKYHTMAGDAAARIYANAEAVTHYTRAIELTKRVSVSNAQLVHLYTSRGWTLHAMTRFDDALATYHELEALGAERDEPSLELAALLPQATVHSTYTSRFDPEKGEAVSKRALALARELKDHEAEARALWNLMLLATFARDDPANATTYGEQSIAIAREHDLKEVLAYALNDISRTYFSTGRNDEAWAVLAEARDLWREIGNLPMLTDNLNSAAAGHFSAGEFDSALKLATESLEVSESIGNIWGKTASLMSIGPVLIERGELGKGLRLMEDALPLSEQANFMGPTVVLRSILAYFYASVGDIDTAFVIAEAGLAKADQVSGTRPFALNSVAHLRLLTGDTAGAEQAMEEAYKEQSLESQDSESGFFGIFSIFYALIGSEIALNREDYKRALTITDQTLARMKETGMRSLVADVLHVKARALLKTGRTDEGREALEEAAALARDIGARRSLWPVLDSLRRIELEADNAAASETLRQEAKEVVEYIAEHADRPSLRSSFLALGPVRAIMED